MCGCTTASDVINNWNATLYEKLNFDFIRDVAPISGLATFSFVMEVNPSVPTKTLPEFIAYAKANPGKINMASAGSGSTHHVSGELFKMMAGVEMVHVPYRGSSPVVQFSRIQLSRRRYPLSGDGRDQRDKI
jgi:tripartite-type tricarboxylate transporter receptor subunit TctC